MQHKNVSRIIAFAISLSAIVFFALPASAASLNVKIRQLNPDSEIQSATCLADQRCELPLTIKDKKAKAEKLTVELVYESGAALFSFKTPDGYLYAANNLPDKSAYYAAIWSRPVTAEKATTDQVKLFNPVVPSVVAAPIYDAAHQAVLEADHSEVMTLEITTQLAP